MNCPPPPARVPPQLADVPLLDRLRAAARLRGDGEATTADLVSWARRFILFYNQRHPAQLGLADVTHFLEHVVKTAAEPLVALAQARSALGLLSRSLASPCKHFERLVRST